MSDIRHSGAADDASAIQTGVATDAATTAAPAAAASFHFMISSLPRVHHRGRLERGEPDRTTEPGRPVPELRRLAQPGTHPVVLVARQTEGLPGRDVGEVRARGGVEGARSVDIGQITG